MTACAFRTKDCPENVEDCPHHLERLTQALAEREAQLLEFWRFARDIHNIVGMDGCFIRVSPSCLGLLGYEPEEMEGKPFMDFVHPDDVAKTLEQWENIRDRGMATYEFQNRYRHADGHYVAIEWRGTAPINGHVYSTARALT